jgi:hypothetical protein
MTRLAAATTASSTAEEDHEPEGLLPSGHADVPAARSVLVALIARRRVRTSTARATTVDPLASSKGPSPERCRTAH